MSSAPPPKLEDALSELELILHELEEGQIGLDESLGRYEQGIRLLKQCFALLENAERRIELCTGVDKEGNPVTRPFVEEGASPEEKPPAGTRRRSKPARTRTVEEDIPSEQGEADDEGSQPGLF